MRIAILWRAKSPLAALESAAVTRRLLALYEPLFADAPITQTLDCGAARLVTLSKPVGGWLPTFTEHDGDDWAFAADYPIGLPTTIGSLCGLGRALRHDPAPVLAELAPPMSLVWSDAAENAIYLQNDGLGQSQWFEYEDARVWAIANRVSALRAVDAPLRPEPEQWGVRFALGWFPLRFSGYTNVRLLGPGTQLRVDGNGVERRKIDVLSNWVHPERRDADECLEFGRRAIERHLRAAAKSWSRATVGLSGGFDSRAITSILRTLGAPFALRVRGNPNRLDVRIANELARIADLPIRTKTDGGLPPESETGLRRCLDLALLWQSGHMTTLKHKTFLASGEPLDGGVVNVMGQHAGIGKADFAALIHANELPASQHEDALVAALMKRVKLPFTASMTERIEELIRASYRQADDYDLHGLHRLHFYFLYEYTRRWGAATVQAQTGVVVTPFLNPDFIRAAYAFPAERLPEKPFHRFITRTHAPDWADFPYESELSHEQAHSDLIPPAPAGVEVRIDPAHAAWRKQGAWKKYDSAKYWDLVGAPIVTTALREGGMWTEIFDRDRVDSTWRRAHELADAIALSHLVSDSA